MHYLVKKKKSIYVMFCQELTKNSQMTRFTTSSSSVLNYATCIQYGGCQSPDLQSLRAERGLEGDCLSRVLSCVWTNEYCSLKYYFLF